MLYSILPIVFAVTEPLGSSQFGDVKNSAVLNILVPVFGEHLQGFLLDIYLQMEWIASRVCIYWVLVDPAICSNLHILNTNS